MTHDDDFGTQPHTPWETAQPLIADGHAVVLWKPGCMFCEQLLGELGEDPAITWVNVYADDAANEAVRAVNDGNELTPTALVGESVLRNPSANELRSALQG